MALWVPMVRDMNDPDLPTPRRTLRLIIDWASYADASGLSPSTIRQYRRNLVCFVADTGVPLNEAGEDDITAYLASLPVHGAMRGSMLRAFRHFYGWLREPNPTARLTTKAPRPKPIPTISNTELRALLRAAFRQERRRGWAIMFLIGTGARIASACAVRPEDVDEERVHFRVTKGNRPYAVPLNRMSRAATKHLLREPVPTQGRQTMRGTLFEVSPSRVRQWMDMAGREAGVRAWPHLMRHAFGTRVYAATKDPLTTARLLNHSDLSQIPRYAHLVDDDAVKASESLRI